MKSYTLMVEIIHWTHNLNKIHPFHIANPKSYTIPNIPKSDTCQKTNNWYEQDNKKKELGFRPIKIQFQRKTKCMSGICKNVA